MKTTMRRVNEAVKKWLGITETDGIRESNVRFVNETSLGRLFGKHTDSGYVIVSACRSDWSDDELENRQINNTKTNDLKDDIQDKGWQYIPVKGGFIEDNTEVVQDSFLVVNYKRKKNTPEQDFGKLKDFATEMCGKYNQDSVLVVAPNENPTYFTRTGDIDASFTGLSVRDSVQKYFTRLGSGRSFSFIESVQPGTINGLRSREMRGEICELADYDRRHK